MHPSWKQALAAEIVKPYFRELAEFVKAERREHVVFPPAEGRVPWTEFSVGKGYVARKDSGPDIVIVEVIGTEARNLCINLLGEPTRTAGSDCASWEIKR